MKKKKIKAVFKGLDGSCGFRTNTEYTLELAHKPGWNIVINEISSSSKKQVYTTSVEYSSPITLLDNWDNIRVL